MRSHLPSESLQSMLQTLASVSPDTVPRGTRSTVEEDAEAQKGEAKGKESHSKVSRTEGREREVLPTALVKSVTSSLEVTVSTSVLCG